MQSTRPLGALHPPLPLTPRGPAPVTPLCRQMFDAVTLLASGRLMYHGPREGITPWFGSLGYNYDASLHGVPSDWWAGLWGFKHRVVCSAGRLAAGKEAGLGRSE